MKANHERVLAERELVGFLQTYCALMAAHIASIRGLMASTTETVMNSVMAISDARESKKKLADTVLVKRRDGEGITKTFQGDDATFRNETVGTSHSESLPLTAAQKLKQYIGGMDDLDASMQDILFRIVGATSTDDVVGQRLDHVSHALRNLEVGLTRMLDPDGRLLQESQMIKLFEEILRVTRKSYTMVEEHQVLDEAFAKRA